MVKCLCIEAAYTLSVKFGLAYSHMSQVFENMCDFMMQIMSVCSVISYKTWWRHQMETFSAWQALYAEKSLVNFPHKGQWRMSLMFSLICTWTNHCAHNRDVGDLRLHGTHYDVTVMTSRWPSSSGTRLLQNYMLFQLLHLNRRKTNFPESGDNFSMS